MEFLIDAQGERRLEDFMESIGALLGNEQRRASFARYAMGLWGDGERKSMEPIAARACPDPRRLDAEHQRLHHFITCANWQDRPLRDFAAQYGVAALTAREPIEAWILDDTGMLITVSRSHARPERHFADSFITARLYLARRIAHWLPRCPLCHYAPAARTRAGPSHIGN